MPGESARTVRSAPQSVDTQSMRRVIFGAAIGQGVEWYDYAIYGYLAGSVGAVFFPSEDRNAALLSAYAAFAVSFLIRPLGGVLFGYIGDRIGRKNTLAVVILLISGSTCLIGLLPGYAAIGIAAPVLLLVLRLLQGLSAGGELAGAVAFLAEHAPVRKRNYIVGFGEMAANAGPLIGASVVAFLATSLGDTAMDDWAWRIPFLIAGPIGLVGLFLRLRVDESPIFQEVVAAGKRAKSPLREAVRQEGGAILRCTGIAVTHMVPYYLILAYLPNHLEESGRLPAGSAYFIVVIALLVKIAVTPVAARSSDRFGRKPVMALAAVGYMALSYPIFAWMNTGGLVAVVLCQVILGIIFGMYSACVFAMMVEMFPTQTRFTSMAIGYNAAAALAGGTAPFIATWLVAVTGNGSAPAFYLIGGAVVSLIALAVSRETAGISLREVPGRTTPSQA
ncbi:MFS transporter (plasmid) [Rhodococcus pseudokoreensis]|uniref:MFS transporter n=1 Tax=Rhodococcus pseudokoreensis TaxID=2811421 RepID=A0A974VYN9_9NOCA|nr:MFS transporter [Rhodococcus pseudokoreensis]QSE87998.1 MFS transporter [Rhodococcus pseudokoreensis]